jgi:CubicO group peptidase (beta-lactamase class C family)
VNDIGLLLGDEKTMPWVERLLVLGLLGSVSLLHAQSPGAGSAPASINPLLPQIEDYIEKGMSKTGVPGVAVAIVYCDNVVYLKGFGVREAGKSTPVDVDTVFQLASVSKPVASTVVAALVGSNEVGWDNKIVDLDPAFKLSDANVTAQVTIRDLLSMRSGLPDSAGDMLEDLAFSRPEILHQMRLLPFAAPFRQKFIYTNFGFTEGGIAPSVKLGQQWENIAEDRLFKPLGMTSTSYRWSDYRDSANKAAIHVFVDGKAVARYLRNPDAEAPAGSASSSIRDLAQWMRLQLANGEWNGQQIVATDALNETHTPQIQKSVDPNTGKIAYYGLGWGIERDAANRVILSHSGAFILGAGTTVQLSPSEQLGIIVLTNAQPTGLAEAVAATFFDLYHYGESTTDWLAITSAYFQKLLADVNNLSTDYSKLPPPTSPTPAKPLSAYVGTYCNDYYGQIEISQDRGSLWMRLPADGTLYTLSHWDGDTFIYRFKGDPGVTARGVKFTLGSKSQVLVENLALEGNGVFVQKSN